MENHVRTLPATMHAFVQDTYVAPEGLEWREVPVPALESDRVLIRVGAASINPYDLYMMIGTPYLVRTQGLRRPKHAVPGVDVAGTIVAVGEEVDGFTVGDRVFGGAPGAFAEYASARSDRIVHTPDNVSDEAAATAGVAGYTAYQGIVDVANVRSGESVLVTGASGGVGSYAIQIAKARGATVTAVCSAPNVGWVKDIGADTVIDYRADDVTKLDQRFDAIFDTVATSPMRSMKRLLKAEGIYVIAGMVTKGKWIAALFPIIRAKLVGIGGTKRMVSLSATASQETLLGLRDLLASGAVVPKIDRRFPLTEVPDAFRHQAEGHAQGKSVIIP